MKKQKYYFWILGCAMNYSDAERISTVLNSLGYERTEKEDEADLFFVISCSVRQSAINRIYGKVKDLRERKQSGQKLTTLLSGCVLETDKKKMKRAFDIIFEINDLEMLPEMLGNIFPASSNSTPQPVIPTEAEGSLDKFRDDKHLSGEYLSITPHYKSSFRAFVPIMTGCDNFCTYCAVPFTRGREKSRPMAEIVAEVKTLVEKGYKEITLLGQNVNSYGNDFSAPTPTTVILNEVKDLDSSTLPQNDTVDEIATPTARNDRPILNNSFVQLLLEIDKIPGDYRVYFYSNHPKDFSDLLIETLPKLVHFPHYIHLPLQSGNDEILKKMNRQNTQKEYLELVERIRKAMPDVNLTSDIIVGFPGETEEQFKDTAEVTRKAEYDMAFIARYSPRSGTVSAKMPDDVTEDEKRRREDILQKIVAETVLEHNKKLVGTTQKILIDEKKGDKYYGRTEGYKVVEIKTDQSLKIGQFIDVKIKATTAWKVTGKI